jgi:pimeloyl-ACP methyl ester carboxylesterase
MGSEKLLNHTLVTAEGRSPERWMVFLHGVFGMGQNFRSLAKSFIAKEPEWGAILCDLRGHGTSQGFSPPHTLASAAGDVRDLVTSLGRDVRAILGHSFGGKVALGYLEAHPGELEVAFIVDSMPGARPHAFAVESTHAILTLLESLEQPLASREAFVEKVKSAGHPPAIAEWLAMNVRLSAGNGYQLRLDLPAIRSMLVDYYARDLWGAVTDRSVTRRLELVVGGASLHYGPADLDRAREIAARERRVSVEIIEGAGHWVHVDAPSALLQAMVRAIEQA